MRIYTAEQEEILKTRKLLPGWHVDGYITSTQFENLNQQTASDLHTTNGFLRLVMFFFTLIVVVAATALSFKTLFSGIPHQSVGILMLLFALLCYTAAEFAIWRARLYRFGIEEALIICSGAFLYIGMHASSPNFSPRLRPGDFIIPAACAVFSLWSWYRFGLSYAFVAAMVFASGMPDYWTPSYTAQHMLIALLSMLGLAAIIAIRSSRDSDYLDSAYSFAEASLWLGLYLGLNLKFSVFSLLGHGRFGMLRASPHYASPFYWTTWVLIWCLPALVLARGTHQKDRFVIVVGIVTTLATFVSNKPYLGWQRHTWDPMILGLALVGAALVVRRWLEQGKGGIRGGFTAVRRSKIEESWSSAGFSVVGFISPASLVLQTQLGHADAPAIGGESGGGGATRQF